MFPKRKLEVRVVKDETAEETVAPQIIDIKKEDIVYVVRETAEVVVISAICILATVFVANTLERIIVNKLK